MSNGIDLFASDLFLYFLFFGSGGTVIVSTILLIIKGKVINRTKRIFIVALLITALSIALYLLRLALAFGNTHPSASPVPFQ